MAERGIIGYGTYVPYWRLDRSRITAAMGAGGGRGHRAVASYDEDTTTLGVEAARNCLRGGSGDASVDRVIFSTSNPAYLDKTNATAIHAALNLPSSVTALDLNGAPRSIEAALGLALNAPGDNLMVLSDIRTGRPTSGDEASGGDGAAAFLIGDGSSSPIIAHELGSATEVAEFLDRYRQPGDDFSRVWEERFGEQAYLPLAQRAVERALAAAELTIDDIDGVSVTGMHARAARGVSRLAGDKLVNDLTSQIGNAGGAQTGLVVASILDDAEPNQNYLIIRLADGATATVMHTTDAIADYEPFRTVGSQIEGGNDALDYNQYLTWRGFLDREPPRRPDPERPGAPPAFRSEDWKYALIGSRDRSSGAIHMPPMRVSMEGGAVDDMEPVRMADIPATIATFTVDRLAFSLSPPMVAVVIDYDGGGRFQAEMTDVDPDEVRIGDRVEMTFRRLYTAEGIHNYFWKARPAAA
ncbi:MAG: hydroxymethylglutaryl-CoA synthase [Acidimicrobiales bacterium]|nr:OB-fold domain-containing protein [Acidimicrobiaceae bacterium]MXY01458.1 hydroxymethylglutaryl-CoA synthase [Acidimicrobiales bacterium]MDE0133911.1 OB-fold domain-containing protein [Acidimicrobiaceae bacterium]MDE0497490.1 OB-fold domain-containing protein [Acidimicrobiaceae bacterium]MYG86941.1 hydroxymethylglutaryl-CoA synthase [Acidimicrobiales bacterium]